MMERRADRADGASALGTRRDPGVVLVTGATGFIGRGVIRDLLMSGVRVVALARSRPECPAGERVWRALPPLPRAWAIDVVEGDLAGADGLAPEAVERLAATVDTVIHCAGDTAFFPDAPAAFRRGHVTGPAGLMTRLARGRLRRWVQVSTAFVCGRRSGRVFEAEGDVGQDFHNPYERVKLDAERILRATAVSAGIDVRIVRPSIVVGAAPATAGGAPSGLFFDFIRLIATVGRLGRGVVRVAAAPEAPFNIVPVDYVVAAIRTLAETPAAAGGTFHAVVSDAPSQADMLAMIAASVGARDVRLVDARRGELGGPTPIERRVRSMIAPYRQYLAQDVTFDDREARRVLSVAGVAAPVLDASAVAHLVGLALEGARVPA